jgi:hypothetical protein
MTIPFIGFSQELIVNGNFNTITGWTAHSSVTAAGGTYEAGITHTADGSGSYRIKLDLVRIIIL